MLVSASATLLSLSVRGASSAIAQGLLAWDHPCVPVVPPSMMRSVLLVETPYLVGVLSVFASEVRKILRQSISDVVYINLDKNEVMTLNMTDPRVTVPDLLTKKVGNTGGQKSASEMLALEFDEILKSDKAEDDASVKKADNTSTALSATRRASVDSTSSKESKKIQRRKSVSSNNVGRAMSLLERREYASSADAAAAFGKLIRSSFPVGAVEVDAPEGDDAEDERRKRQSQPASPMYYSPSQDVDLESFDTCLASENEYGEECIRSALTSFFIHMFGDMGMYISESHGTFMLDQRKFLLRKEQLGEKAGSPTYLVLEKLSASRMFAAHARGRIDDMCMVVRDRSNIMPRKFYSR